MSTASILPATARSRRRLSIRRLAAWLTAHATDPKAALWLVTGFAVLHAALWTLILANLAVVAIMIALARPRLEYEAAVGYACLVPLTAEAVRQFFDTGQG